MTTEVMTEMEYVTQYLRKNLSRYVGEPASPACIEDVSRTLMGAIKSLHRPLRRACGSKALNGRGPRALRGKRVEGDLFTVRGMRVDFDHHQGIINYEIVVSQHTQPPRPDPMLLAGINLLEI